MSSKGIAGFNGGLVRSVAGGYTPTEWATGDVITAEKLNHMEDGIEACDNFVPTFTIQNDNTVTCDKTYEEVLTAVMANKCHIARVIWAVMQGYEDYYHVATVYSSPYPDERFMFELFTPTISNDKLISISAKRIIYHSSGTIECKLGDVNLGE